MLNLFLYHLTSGQAWFSCGLLFLLVMAADACGWLNQPDRSRRGLRGILSIWLRAFLVVLMIVAGLTSTPVPLWLLGPLLLSCLLYVFLGYAHPNRTRRLAFAACAGILVVVSLVVELPYHFAQPPATARPKSLYVVADSLAAGMGGEKTTWPALLAKRTGIVVHDLSFPGANTHYALQKLTKTLEKDSDPEAWMLLSIGGNDLLGRTKVEDFATDLDRLLAVARGNGPQPRTVLMQELPLIPGAWRFGAEQRRLAAKHGVMLIPKRVLADIVLGDANVLDGLHLSPAGHIKMAEAMEGWLGET